MLSCIKEPKAATAFDRATSLQVRSGGGHCAELDPAWGSLVGIHGGYQVAIAAMAASDLEPERPIRTLTTSFLRPGQAGVIDIHTATVRRGRSLTTLAIDIRQDGALLNTTRVTLAERRDGPAWHLPAPVTMRPRSECVPIEPPPMVNHFAHAEGLLDPDHIPFTHGERAVVRGYFRPLEGRAVDAAWLAMAVDWFPPAAFVRIDPPAGGISVDLTTHIHHVPGRLGDDEWLTAEFESAISVDGMALERGWIAGPDGTVVAESFHTRWIG